MRIEEGLVEDSTIESEGSEHDAIHEHPPDERGSSSFVEAWDTLFSDGLEKTLEGTGEAIGGRGLQADFDRVERMTNCVSY